MKKILVLALATGFALSSCSKDDEDDSVSIVGTWRPTGEKTISGANGATLDTYVDACYNQSTFDFRSNNTVVNHLFEKVAGVCQSYSEETMPYSYNAATKILTVDYENSEVIKLTENELEIVIDQDDENGDGIDDKIVLVLKR